MASGDISRVIRAPGRLVVGPTNLSAAYPHGGTEVGKTRQVVLVQTGQPFRVISEGLGETSEILEGPTEWYLAAAMRGWDDDAVAQLFANNYTAGDPSGHAGYDEPKSRNVGSTALGRAKVLLWKPDDPIHVPSVLVYRGVPWWSDGAEIPLSSAQDVDLPVVVHAMQDGSGNTLAIKFFSDLSL